ncbi:TIGR03084 family metal-binding protein [Streptomyces boninensis]|uniref:TIGR03084 family metal-binding protein n=1 Tax=Streptomyces boninensis TaxID=2039455 RepID=UPI003B21146E
MADPGVVLDDLRAESAELDGLVARLGDEAWGAPTPAEGWSVAHQIAHLLWTDERSLLAATEPEAFVREFTEAVEASGGDLQGFVDQGAEEWAGAEPAVLLARWREAREALQRVLRERPADAGKIPWYATPMSVASMATARLMETWAHGQDVADALGVERKPTERIRHVAWIGVRTRDFAFLSHGIQPPEGEFRIELTPPDGAGVWAYGPEDAEQRISGPALDFCLLVCQRIHRDDTALRATGADAERWLGIAQAFAGPSGGGREARG